MFIRLSQCIIAFYDSNDDQLYREFQCKLEKSGAPTSLLFQRTVYQPKPYFQDLKRLYNVEKQTLYLSPLISLLMHLVTWSRCLKGNTNWSWLCSVNMLYVKDTISQLLINIWLYRKLPHHDINSFEQNCYQKLAATC